MTEPTASLDADAEPAGRADEQRRKAIVTGLWQRLYEHDFEAVGALFAPDGHYSDVPSPDEGAFGPTAIAARLRLGLEPIESGPHELSVMIAEGSVVITEHTEEWKWHTGEQVRLPFTSVMEFGADDLITRWWDYWDLQTLIGAAPQWWIEQIMTGAAEIGLRDEDAPTE